jgi:uncharacterized protein DUF4124
MKTVCIAAIAMAASSAFAQSTIYKHVDESGRVTYSNKPMKGAAVLDLEPLTIFPVAPTAAVAAAQPVAASKPQGALERTSLAIDKPQARPAVAIVTPLPRPSLASIEPQVQKRRDDERRRILEQELNQEQATLEGARSSLAKEQQNPELVAAVRMAQAAVDPSASQLAEFRANIDKASGRIRGLQATVAEHERNVEALTREIGALK